MLVLVALVDPVDIDGEPLCFKDGKPLEMKFAILGNNGLDPLEDLHAIAVENVLSRQDAESNTGIASILCLLARWRVR